MKQKMYRTQILLEPEQHQALVEVARREGRSVSDVVRGYVGEKLEEKTRDSEERKQRQLAAIQKLQQQRKEYLAEHGGRPLDFDVVAAINRAREEQDERNFQILFGDRD